MLLFIYHCIVYSILWMLKSLYTECNKRFFYTCMYLNSQDIIIIINSSLR